MALERPCLPAPVRRREAPCSPSPRPGAMERSFVPPCAAPSRGPPAPPLPDLPASSPDQATPGARSRQGCRHGDPRPRRSCVALRRIRAKARLCFARPHRPTPPMEPLAAPVHAVSCGTSPGTPWLPTGAPGLTMAPMEHPAMGPRLSTAGSGARMHDPPIPVVLRSAPSTSACPGPRLHSQGRPCVLSEFRKCSECEDSFYYAPFVYFMDSFFFQAGS